MSATVRTRGSTSRVSISTLMEELPPLAIRSKQDYERMVKAIDKLAVLGKRTSAQERYLETLTILVEAYEAQHVAMDGCPRGPRRTGLGPFIHPAPSSRHSRRDGVERQLLASAVDNTQLLRDSEPTSVTTSPSGR